MAGEFGKNVNESRNPEGRWITAMLGVADGRWPRPPAREEPRWPSVKSNGVVELVVRMFGCTGVPGTENKVPGTIHLVRTVPERRPGSPFAR